MPVRFQVDPDFYDHPKVTGMSDAAFALWVRAGSYCAAKLTNGFVAEDVVTYTLRAKVEAADELVDRGLWRRRRGGYVFHQWSGRNLTRERVEEDRKRDAKRKRVARQVNTGTGPAEGDLNAKPQVRAGIVRADSERTPDGIQAESDRNPPVSVSVSVSESVSTTKDSLRSSSDPPQAGAKTRRAPAGADRFEEFYDAYAHKVARGAAAKAWSRALKEGANPDQVITAAAAHRDRDRRAGTEQRFRKHPSTWLNSQCWLDDLSEPAPDPVFAEDTPHYWRPVVVGDD